MISFLPTPHEPQHLLFGTHIVNDGVPKLSTTHPKRPQIRHTRHDLWRSLVQHRGRIKPPISIPETAHISWPVILLPFLPFFGGFSWLVLDSWHHGRVWWQLLLWSGSGSGVSQLLGFTGFVLIAISMWAWTIVVAVIVFKTGFMGEREDDRKEPLATSDVNIPRLSETGQA